MKFLKEHLVGQDYAWKENLNYEGKPSRRLFDRFNGDQVLFIINGVMELFQGDIVEEGRRIEKLIANQLPMGPLSEKSVWDWVSGNYHGPNHELKNDRSLSN